MVTEKTGGGEKEGSMTIQCLGSELWEVVWGDGTAELCREKHLRKAGFRDCAIDTSKDHPEQIFEV